MTLLSVLFLFGCTTSGESTKTSTPDSTNDSTKSVSEFCANMKSFDGTIGDMEDDEDEQSDVQSAATLAQEIAKSAPTDIQVQAEAFADGWEKIQDAAKVVDYDEDKIEASERSEWDNSNLNTQVTELVQYANKECDQDFEVGHTDSSDDDSGDDDSDGGDSDDDDSDSDGGGGGGGGSGGGGCGHGGWDGYGGGGCD